MDENQERRSKKQEEEGGGWRRRRKSGERPGRGKRGDEDEVKIEFFFSVSDGECTPNFFLSLPLSRAFCASRSLTRVRACPLPLSLSLHRREMERVALALLLLLSPLAAARRDADPAPPSPSPPPPPKWPESFSLSYNFSLPYTREFQSSELVYDVVVHRDADRRLAKQVRKLKTIGRRRKKPRSEKHLNDLEPLSLIHI